MTRTRNCDNPAQIGGGRNCFGAAEETVMCNTEHCSGKHHKFSAHKSRGKSFFLQKSSQRFESSYFYISDKGMPKVSLFPSPFVATRVRFELSIVSDQTIPYFEMLGCQAEGNGCNHQHNKIFKYIIRFLDPI